MKVLDLVVLVEVYIEVKDQCQGHGAKALLCRIAESGDLMEGSLTF
jgi:hypothetical protein